MRSKFLNFFYSKIINIYQYRKSVRPKMLQKMSEEQWLNIVTNQKDNIKKVRVRKWDHISDFKLGENSFISESAYDKYINLINPNMHLGKVVSKLRSIGTVQTPPESNQILDPSVMADDLIRFSELTRVEPMFVYKDENTKSIVSAVSQRHSRVYDLDVYNVVKSFFENVPSEMSFENDIHRSRIIITLPELAVELGSDNAMNFRISVGNSEFGYGSCNCRAGSYEQWCSNGAMGWKTQFQWKQIHISSPEVILRNLAQGIVDMMAQADTYMAILEQANEVTDRYIEDNVNVIAFLREDKFRLLKREAEGVYRRIRNNPRYQRFNAFDVGRAIAEEALNTHTIERRVWMEQLSGKVMVAQVT